MTRIRSKTNRKNKSRRSVGFHGSDSEGVSQSYQKFGQSMNTFKALIERFSKPCTTILDTCVGGENSGQAAISGKRSFIGFDIDKKYILKNKKLFKTQLVQNLNDIILKR